MLWLDRPPVLRWLAAGVLVSVAAWSELSPAPTSSATFLVEDVPAGTPLQPRHVEQRPVPAGTMETVDPEGVAAADLHGGDPLVGSMVTHVAVPPGWVVIEADVPSHAPPGAAAIAVILEGESPPIEFSAVVVDGGGSDPFEGASGTVAVPGEWVAPAAAAAAEGRLVIGVSSGQD